MKKLLNVLYVTTEGTYLRREGESVKIEKDSKLLLQVPIHTLQGIVCLNRVMLSPQLMQLCAERQVLVSFFSPHGEFHARVQGEVAGNVLLRRIQYRWGDDADKSAEIAQAIVAAKLANCRTVLLRCQREQKGNASANGNSSRLAAVADYLARSLERLLTRSSSVDELRGLEGDAARQYFSVFDHLILSQKSEFTFRGRSRRPPLDPVNALLSFVYTLLVHDITAALEGVGLDPYVGFLHADRPGRCGLALDLMEELRPALADRLVLTLINRQQVKPSGFTTAENGAVQMSEATRREVLQAWQSKKQEELRHPFFDESVAWGLIPHLQSLLLARHVRGDLDTYPAFVAR
jgi:CRISPR-associated protein Cas1